MPKKLKRLKKKIPIAIIIDGNHLAYRSFWSLSGFTNREGTPSGAFFGSVRVAKALVRKFNPDLAIIVFDGKPIKQLKRYKDYKKKRQDNPQFDIIRKLLKPQLKDLRLAFKALGVYAIRHAKMEADPIVATLASYLDKQGYRVYIISSDTDYYQCLTHNISMYDAIRSRIITLDIALKATGLVNAYQMCMQKVLMGDRSDNIPPVKRGTGKVRATKLLTGPDAEWEKFKQENKKNISLNKDLIQLPTSVYTLPEWLKRKLNKQKIHIDVKGFKELLTKYGVFSILVDVKKFLEVFKELQRRHSFIKTQGEFPGD